MGKSGQVSPWQQMLPPELWEAIIDALRSLEASKVVKQQTWAACRRTCRSWARGWGPGSLKELQVRGAVQHLPAGWQRSVSSLVSLKITESPDLSDNDVAMVGRLDRLTSLKLSGCNGVTDDGIQALHSLASLTSLELSCCEKVHMALALEGLRCRLSPYLASPQTPPPPPPPGGGPSQFTSPPSSFTQSCRISLAPSCCSPALTLCLRPPTL